MNEPSVPSSSDPPPLRRSTPSLSRYGPVIVPAAADADVVRALDPPAAPPPVDELVEVVAVPVQGDRLDLLLVGQGMDRGVGGQPQPGLGVQLDQLDAAPERAEGQPQRVVRAVDDARVDGVVVALLVGPDDDARGPSTCTPGRPGRGSGWWPGRWPRSACRRRRPSSRAGSGRRGGSRPAPRSGRAARDDVGDPLRRGRRTRAGPAPSGRGPWTAARRRPGRWRTPSTRPCA